ncbi:MAG: 2-amino-4-hydroxy-6-hydroxymethyldihydropteridine diphosphokinase [Chromatiales bacterium]|nr:2-amino-4-hydroxy-6-hydroxymethyldihydropteridine diphosphokinase [Chromatiales bacterium]
MSAGNWIPAYVGVGSNLDGPEEQVRNALEALDRIPETLCIVRSSAWRNPALGPQPQPDFVNAVAGLLTRLPPERLLEELLAIERRQGRDRSAGVRWGPRRVDLDLLVHGATVMNTDALVLPHPGMATRNFVLFPLLEIAPGLRVPGLGPVPRLAAALNQEEQQADTANAWAIPVTSPSKAR